MTTGFDTNKWYIDLAPKKIELVKMQLELTKNEHYIKLQQEKELFILQKELLLTKIEIKKKKLNNLNSVWGFIAFELLYYSIVAELKFFSS